MTAPTPYPAEFYAAHRWLAVPAAWCDLTDGPAMDKADAMDAITGSFWVDAMPADLTTVRVWHFTADFAPRDVTEDVLLSIGADLSDRFGADEFPAAFLRWADADIRDAAAEQAEADRAADERRYAAREFAA